ETDGATVEISSDAEYTNGRTTSRDGAVIECSHGRRAVQIDRTASQPGAPYAPEILVDRFGQARLNSPNDVVEKSDGTIWFTDPSYGIKRPDEGHAGEEEYGDRYVFRFDPADGSLCPVVIDVEAPNGLAFSPDESILSVADSSTCPARRALDPRLRRLRGSARQERPVAGGGESWPARRFPRGHGREPLVLLPHRHPGVHPGRGGARRDPGAGEGGQLLLRRGRRAHAVHLCEHQHLPDPHPRQGRRSEPAPAVAVPGRRGQPARCSCPSHCAKVISPMTAPEGSPRSAVEASPRPYAPGKRISSTRREVPSCAY